MPADEAVRRKEVVDKARARSKTDAEQARYKKVILIVEPCAGTMLSSVCARVASLGRTLARYGSALCSHRLAVDWHRRAACIGQILFSLVFALAGR